jgi:hypothetical protein
MDTEDQDGQFTFSPLVLTISSLCDVSSNARAETPSSTIHGQQHWGCWYSPGRVCRRISSLRAAGAACTLELCLSDNTEPSENSISTAGFTCRGLFTRLHLTGSWPLSSRLVRPWLPRHLMATQGTVRALLQAIALLCLLTLLTLFTLAMYPTRHEDATSRETSALENAAVPVSFSLSSSAQCSEVRAAIQTDAVVTTA